MFQPLTGLYEPSAIQQLADGRFLVVEDEKEHPFSLLTLSNNGVANVRPLLPPLQGDDAVWKLDDLEALALDRLGYLYALTSHSRNAEGEEKKSRDKLVRFRVNGERMTDPKLVRGLKPALIAAHPALAAAAEIRDVKNQGGLNIEALEISADGQQLLIGFRSPLIKERAVIARVENFAAMFEADVPPRIAPSLTTIDLNGEGMRTLCYFDVLKAYLIISGPVARAAGEFRLWFWRDVEGEAAKPVSVAGLPGFAQVEGISPATINGQQRIVMVSDEGSRAENRYARYLLLDPAQLILEA